MEEIDPKTTKKKFHHECFIVAHAKTFNVKPVVEAHAITLKEYARSN